MTEEAIEESENQLTLANFAAAERQSKHALSSIRVDGDGDNPLLIRALEVCMQSLYQQRRYLLRTTNLH